MKERVAPFFCKENLWLVRTDEKKRVKMIPELNTGNGIPVKTVITESALGEEKKKVVTRARRPFIRDVFYYKEVHSS